MPFLRGVNALVDRLFTCSQEGVGVIPNLYMPVILVTKGINLA